MDISPPPLLSHHRKICTIPALKKMQLIINEKSSCINSFKYTLLVLVPIETNYTIFVMNKNLAKFFKISANFLRYKTGRLFFCKVPRYEFSFSLKRID